MLILDDRTCPQANIFDVTTADPLSIRFRSPGATEAHRKGHIIDVDGDSDLALVLHFKT
jgi:hypothetical protein